MHPATTASLPTVLRAHEGDAVTIDGLGVRFLVSAAGSGGGFSLVEHPVAPRSMGAGLHTHSREDEFSWVLDGQIGVQLGDDVLRARTGDFVLKPRGVPHAFWNPGERPAKVLELIAPGGMEGLFREVAEAWAASEPDLDRFDDIMGRYGLEFDIASEEWIPVREGFAAGGSVVDVPQTRFGPAPPRSVLASGEGAAVRLGGLRARVLVAGPQSGGGFALVEQGLDPRSVGSPLHTHRDEDEWSYVVGGEVAVQVGDDIVHAGPGDLVFAPRGVPHAFWNPSERPARLLDVIAPAGFERFFGDVAPLLPPQRPTPAADGLAEVAARFGLELDLGSFERIARREGLPSPVR